MFSRKAKKLYLKGCGEIRAGVGRLEALAEEIDRCARLERAFQFPAKLASQLLAAVELSLSEAEISFSGKDAKNVLTSAPSLNDTLLRTIRDFRENAASPLNRVVFSKDAEVIRRQLRFVMSRVPGFTAMTQELHLCLDDLTASPAKPPKMRLSDSAKDLGSKITLAVLIRMIVEAIKRWLL